MPCSRSFPVHPINAMEVDADTNSSDTAVKAVAMDFLTKKAYAPPSWASHIKSIPSHTCSIGQFPTPIHKWNLPNLPPNTEVWLKKALTSYFYYRTPPSEVETDDGDCSVAVVLDPSPSDCAGPPPQMASENGIDSRKRKLEMVESPGIKSLVSDEIEVPP